MDAPDGAAELPGAEGAERRVVAVGGRGGLDAEKSCPSPMPEAVPAASAFARAAFAASGVTASRVARKTRLIAGLVLRSSLKPRERAARALHLARALVGGGAARRS